MTKPSKSDALIAQLHAEIVNIWRLMALTSGDDGMNQRLDELAEMTRCLAQAPARTLCELEIKISVLCTRLREEMRPEVRGEVLTWMLADSIRHDCHLIAPVRSPPAGQ